MLLTNSYVLYCKYHKMVESKKALSHYDYIKQISLAWINHDLYWPQPLKVAAKKRKSQANDTRRVTRAKKSLDTDLDSLISKGSKCCIIDDKTIDPISGTLRRRFNTAVQHFPEKPSGKRPRCQLHRWARNREGQEVFATVSTCSVCRVNLCLSCYKLFHTEANILGKKKDIARS